MNDFLLDDYVDFFFGRVGHSILNKAVIRRYNLGWKK
jgi:hypothetical protein